MTITIERVVDAAISLAQSNPEYVYEQPDPDTARCFYMYDGKPSCIFGQALVVAGIDPAVIAEKEEELHEDTGDTGITDFLDVLNIAYPVEVKDALNTAQSRQDSGHAWRETLSVLRIARDRLAAGSEG